MIDLRRTALFHTNGRIGILLSLDARLDWPPTPENPEVAPPPPQNVYELADFSPKPTVTGVVEEGVPVIPPSPHDVQVTPPQPRIDIHDLSSLKPRNIRLE